MFESFFPKPKLFFGSFAIWGIVCIVVWLKWGQPIGELISLGDWFGFMSLDYSALTTWQEQIKELQKNLGLLGAKLGAHQGAATFGIAPLDQETFGILRQEAAELKEKIILIEAKIEAHKNATSFWFYQYLIPCYGIFLAFWHWFARDHKWLRWSLYGSALILFVTWFQVQLDVMINHWFGDFYDMAQSIFEKPGTITEDEYYGRLLTFFIIAAIAVLTIVLNRYFIQHFNFRWRTAMNEYYTKRWGRIKHVEGVSQRIQDDTMKFAEIMESLGVGFLEAVMTLIAFLPLLWGFSKLVTTLPIIGPVLHGLVIVAVAWAVLGMVVLMLTGYYLPKLQFINERVEHAYRGELVLYEKDIEQANPMTLKELFGHIRKNYFRLYFHYMYFNVVRYSYLQASVLVPYVALAPTLLSKEAIMAGFTLGLMQQTVRAFGRVESSFQYLVHSWPIIVKLLAIHKRLKALDASIYGRELPKIDRDFLLDGTEK